MLIGPIAFTPHIQKHLQTIQNQAIKQSFNDNNHNANIRTDLFDRNDILQTNTHNTFNNHINNQSSNIQIDNNIHNNNQMDIQTDTNTNHITQNNNIEIELLSTNIHSLLSHLVHSKQRAELRER